LAEVFVPTRLIKLTAEQDRFVASCVDSGHYASASEVMCAALRLQEQQEREYAERMDLLRTAIEEGLAKGSEDAGLFERLRDAIGRPSTQGAEQRQASAG
jgi:putative addiction module CopG family antidote